jgi:hypothetical protein
MRMNGVFRVGERVVWHAKWLKEKRTGTVSALHRRNTYIVELNQPLPGPDRGNKTVAFGYELDALSEFKLLKRLDPPFERFMQKVLSPIDCGVIAPTREPL